MWQAHLAVLREALRRRKPDALARVRSETGRLEREIEALQGRKRLAERAGGSDDALSGQLGESIADRLRRISDLAGLTRQSGAKPANGDVGPVAEGAVRPAAIDPIDLLHGKGRLDHDQVRAAHEIRWVHEAITRAGRARVSHLSEIGQPKGWQEMPLPERAALIHAKRLVPWAQRLRVQAPATLDIVLRVVVMGTAIYPVARKHRLGWSTCVARLADGLDQYWRRPEDGARPGKPPVSRSAARAQDGRGQGEKADGSPVR